MLKNYLTISFRNLLRHKAYSFINILGLTIGLACCLIIFLFITDELQFDTFHSKASRIYRIINTKEAQGRQSQLAVTPPALGPALKSVFPEVQQAVRIFDMGENLMAAGDKKLFETGFILADSTIFEVFSFQLVRGDIKSALTGPKTLVISETMARKYFGSSNPVGKELIVSGNLTFHVTGVMKDVPAHSHLKINCIGSFNTLKEMTDPKRLENWRWQQFYTYILLPEHHQSAALEAKLPAFLDKYAHPEISNSGMQYKSRLQALTDIHLYSSDLEYDMAGKGNVQHVYAFTAIALFILLIACFNFMNLSTARSALRAKEVGIRKVVGASRLQLICQFLGESILLISAGLVLAFVIVQLTLPVFNEWSGKALSLKTVFNIQFMPGLFMAVLLVGILAGSYPAFFLSAYKTIKVLKGELGMQRQSAYSLRKMLVIIQFTVSCVLIIGASVVFNQLKYIQEKNLGFTKEQLIELPIRNDNMREKYATIKSELLQNPAITSATACYGIPGGMFAGDGILIPGQKSEFTLNMFLVDQDYIPTLGMQMAAGRNFSRAFPGDVENGFILNEAAVRQLGWGEAASAIGKEIHWEKWFTSDTTADSLKRGTIIGVVKDFHYKSLHQKIEPAVMHIFPAAYSSIVVRTHPENMQATLDFLKTKWLNQDAAWPFEYDFLDERFASHYQAEQVFSKLFGVFTFLSIFIACMGLFGLTSFTAQQRAKEIGIRKVLGASVAGIVVLLSKDFLRLVLIALLLAMPIAYYAMNQWLADFAYRIEIGLSTFLLAGGVAILIAFLTVSWQSIKAALSNPVKSLRNE